MVMQSRFRRLCWAAWAVCWLPMLSCSEPMVILPETLELVALLPSHGAVDIATDTSVLLTFSHALPEQTDLQQHFRLTLDESGDEVVTQKTLLADGHTVEILPQNVLSNATTYRITIVGALNAVDEHVHALPVDVSGTFTTSP